MPPARSTARQRHAAARAALRRIDTQQAQLAHRYATATTPTKRLGVVAAAVAAAAAPGGHQPNQQAADQAVAGLIEQAHRVLAELHAAQRSRARKTLTRTERRCRHDGRHHSAGRAG